MSDDPGFGDVTRRRLLTSAFIAATGAGAAVGAMTMTSDGASARVAGLGVDDVSVSGVNGELASLTIAPAITAEWSDLSRSVEEVSIRIAASVPAASNGEVATHTTTEVSGTSGSLSHEFNENDLLEIFDPATFNDDTEDGEPKEVNVDLSAGVEFYDDDGEQFGPAPVDLLSFTVSVNNASVTDQPSAIVEATDTTQPTATDQQEERTCRAEPESCEGVSMSGSINTGASAKNPAD